MKEQDLQKKIIDYLESKNYYVVKIISANKNGVPDIIFLRDGKFFAIEVKAPGKKNTATKLQHYHINLINNTGGKAIITDSLEEVKDIF